MYGEPIPDIAVEAHVKCVSIQDEVAEMLVPGAIPSEIYNAVISSLDKKFLENFMGFGNRTVKFLGHGIGLLIDETPVIAKGFNEPIEEGMVFALEPKKGIKGVGMVGIENTFIVTDKGSECITGSNQGLISVGFGK
jgi:Xaa-Pro aminopeptidase